jgi:hypothetical protein
LDILYEDLGISKLKFLIKKVGIKFFFSAATFFQFLVIKSLDPDPESINRIRNTGQIKIHIAGHSGDYPFKSFTVQKNYSKGRSPFSSC